jgi:hypothetical protein
MLSKDDIISNLIYPMYVLNYVSKIDDDLFNTKFFIDLQNGLYSENKVNSIIISLEWAKQNSDYDFVSIIPGLTLSNEEIYEYLIKSLEIIHGFRNKGNESLK